MLSHRAEVRGWKQVPIGIDAHDKPPARPGSQTRDDVLVMKIPTATRPTLAASNGGLPDPITVR
jgi:hypothetical protein